MNCLGDVLPGSGLPIRPVAPGSSGTGPSSDKKSANSAQNPANSSTEILETIAGLPGLSTSTDTVPATDSSDVSETKNGFENGPGISPDSSQQTFGSETTSQPPTTSFSGLGRLDPIESEEQTNTTERQTNNKVDIEDYKGPSGINEAQTNRRISNLFDNENLIMKQIF